MLRSIYVYPTVARVFFSERFRNLSQNHTVEGPFMVTPHLISNVSSPYNCSEELRHYAEGACCHSQKAPHDITLGRMEA